MTAPATATWRGYISHPLGFAFAAPGELKVETGTYRSAIAGLCDTLVYCFVNDDIEKWGKVVKFANIKPE